MVDIKLPPHNVASEQSILGGLMVDASAWTKVQGVICEHDFYIKKHKILFKALMDMFADDHAVDAVTVDEYLQQKQFSETVGGLRFLADLVNSVHSAANISAHANIVREKSSLRQLISVAAKISDLAFAPDGKADKVLADAETAIFEIAEKRLRGKEGFSSLKEILTEVIEIMTEEHDNPTEGVLGLASGFKDLDNAIGGFQPGQLIVIGARPSMGKTCFAMNIAEHVAVNQKESVAFFSMEMEKHELGKRFLSSQSAVHLSHIQRASEMVQEEFARVAATLARGGDASLHIDPTPTQTMAEIRSRCIRLQSQLKVKPLGLIVVDYIQMMQSDVYDQSRNNVIEDITRGLKRLAKEFKIPIVALSQLNRSLENRPNKRPIMSDLRESGGIEQDADIIMFLYRDEVYHDDSPKQGVAEVIIAKNRNGALSTVHLSFEGPYVRFRDLDRGYGYD